MNNDSTASTSDPPPGAEDQPSANAQVEEANNDGDEGRRKLRMQREKRGKLLDDLIRNIDIMIYGELSVIYYLE